MFAAFQIKIELVPRVFLTYGVEDPGSEPESLERTERTYDGEMEVWSVLER